MAANLSGIFITRDIIDYFSAETTHNNQHIRHFLLDLLNIFPQQTFLFEFSFSCEWKISGFPRSSVDELELSTIFTEQSRLILQCDSPNMNSRSDSDSKKLFTRSPCPSNDVDACWRKTENNFFFHEKLAECVSTQFGSFRNSRIFFLLSGSCTTYIRTLLNFKHVDPMSEGERKMFSGNARNLFEGEFSRAWVFWSDSGDAFGTCLTFLSPSVCHQRLKNNSSSYEIMWTNSCLLYLALDLSALNSNNLREPNDSIIYTQLDHCPMIH